MTFSFDSISDAIGKSEQLLLLSQQSKWDDFLELDAERQALISGFDFKDISLSEADYTKLQHQMNKLISLNEKLESTCLAQREEIAGEMKKIRKNNKVAQAYMQ